MLRRAPSIAALFDEDDDAPRQDTERSAAASLDRRKLGALRPSPERQPTPAAEPEPTYPEIERRNAKTERRSMDELRAEYQQTLVTEHGNQNLPRSAMLGRLRPSRVVLVVVALLAGGLAAYLALQREPAPTATEAPAQAVQEKTIQEARTQILVAKQPIGMGQRLSPATIGWEDWPEGAVRPEYLTVAATPDAITSMTGSVARFEIFPGEPIRQDKLAKADQGYLSAILGSGMRAVSLTVTPDSASGGFVVPNDHVDVVLTRPSPTSGAQISETVLRNVKVLAINTRLGETGTTGAPTDPADPRAEVFSAQAIATLELDESQAEIAINASAGGRLALVLRSMVDASQASTEGSAVNQEIRMTSPFWTK